MIPVRSGHEVWGEQGCENRVQSGNVCRSSVSRAIVKAQIRHILDTAHVRGEYERAAFIGSYDKAAWLISPRADGVSPWDEET